MIWIQAISRMSYGGPTLGYLEAFDERGVRKGFCEMS